MNTSIIKNILKLILAIGIIVWLVNSGKLDFNLLSTALKNPFRMIIGFLLFSINILIVTYRWQILLHTKTSKKLQFKKVVKYNYIGVFFNSVLPGSVTGDLIKVFYIKEADKNLTKKFLFASVLIDRVVGLFGLIILLGVCTVFNYSELSALSNEVKNLLDFNLLLLLCVVLGFIALYFFKNLPHRISKLISFSILDGIRTKLLDIWDNLVAIRKKLLILTAISIFVQWLAVFIFWYVAAPYAGDNFSIKYAYSFIPLGFIAIAVPLAPSGLGVGHAVFDKLFSFFNVMNGASLFNLFFFVTLLANLVGIIPYILHKKK